MSVNDTVAAKVRHLPEPLAQEVNDLVDFLLLKNDATRWQLWNQFAEAQTLADLDSNYLPDLEDYEQRLANGEIRW